MSTSPANQFLLKRLGCRQSLSSRFNPDHYEIISQLPDHGWLRGQAHGPATTQTLAERLGYKPTDKILIVNGDDVGMCHAANEATIESLETGLMTSSTMMVPCPWFNEIADYAKRNPQRDFGIHLCLTSEWKFYRWGSVAPHEQVSGLLDPDGYMWRSVQEVYAHSKPEEALIEGRAQIKRAPGRRRRCHAYRSHMGTFQYNPAYMDAYVQLAVEFDLPLRMASQATMEKNSAPTLRDKYDAPRALSFTDYFVHEELPQEKNGVKQFWAGILKNLKPGVTELYIHASKPTEELKAITNSWKTRGEQYETFTHDVEVRQIVKDEKIILIGYRPLRELQRKARKSGQ